MVNELGYEFTLGDYTFRFTSSPDADYVLLDDGRFYGHDDLFKSLSESYPREVFMLKGDGYERKDFWAKYYRNGRVHRVEGDVVYPDFEESKLEEI